MINLLKNKLVDSINSDKSHLPPFNGSGMVVRNEHIADLCFDIQDKMATIKQPAGTGSATYNNQQGKQLLFIDYEDFINQLPDLHKKDIKKCDFIAYELEGQSVFILNELSLSCSPRNKFSKAREQLRETLFYLSAVPEIKLFMDQYNRKVCVFSNKTKVIQSPDNMAASFELIKNYLPEPIIHDFQPIKKMGFEFIETAIIDV